MAYEPEAGVKVLPFAALCTAAGRPFRRPASREFSPAERAFRQQFSVRPAV
jgi:hypothetical protein